MMFIEILIAQNHQKLQLFSFVEIRLTEYHKHETGWLFIKDTAINGWDLAFAGAGVILLLEALVRYLVPAYRQPIIGWMEDLETMAIDDLRQWYNTWYAPNNATLVVVGDVRAKEVFALAKEHFGLFGSEEGREWAIPHADYMEGLLSHKLAANRPDRGFSRRGHGTIIPMFEIIYGDCINLYGHQGDRARPGRPDYILNCLI